ncbi:MAG: GntR family transcriptional regulator [Planctomycetes bacterium]|nr:GntR family transcriptional regulator [Planctomycetota bacterium]
MSVILHIDLGSGVAAYRQVVDGLRAMLVAGELRPGDRLPPVRQLAADLTVHHNTVAEAYRTLAQEGWLDLRRGRGATVVARQRPRPEPGQAERFTQRVGELAAQALAGGLGPQQVAAILQGAARDLLAEGRFS